MGITCPLHIKKIKLAIKRTHEPGQGGDRNELERVWARRNQLRLFYEQTRAACVLQRNVRRFLAQRFVQRVRVRAAAIRSRRAVEEQISQGGVWYTDLLPPILINNRPVLKGYGSRAAFRGAYGWGYWRGTEWKEALPPEELKTLEGRELDAHDSLFFVNRLDRAAPNRRKATRG
jgi:hypothetical protein